MKFFILLLSIAVFNVYSQQVIAQDKHGLIVEVKEKYGGLLIDTCTVLMNHGGQFVLVYRDGASGWFPSSFHSVRVIGRLVYTEERLADAEKSSFAEEEMKIVGVEKHLKLN